MIEWLQHPQFFHYNKGYNTIARGPYQRYLFRCTIARAKLFLILSNVAKYTDYRCMVNIRLDSDCGDPYVFIIYIIFHYLYLYLLHCANQAT
jgi:hypothetical protein